VGVLLYELLVGAPLIRESDELRALEAVRTGRWVRPVVLAPELPEALLALVESALHLDPSRRPRSAVEFAALLRPFRSHVFAPSAPPSDGDWNVGPVTLNGPYAPPYHPTRGSRPVPRPRADSACPVDMLVDPTFPRSPIAPRLEALHADAFGGATPSEEPPPATTEPVGNRLGWLVGAGLGFGLLITVLEVL